MKFISIRLEEFIPDYVFDVRVINKASFNFIYHVFRDDC